MDQNRELKDPELVIQAAKESIKALNAMAKASHKEVSPSEYAKILIWQKCALWELLHEPMEREIEKDKRNGWEIVEHTWCGKPWHEFEIPSLGLKKEF